MLSLWATSDVRPRWILASLTAVLLLEACGYKHPEQRQHRYSISGLVLDRDEIHSQLTIAHDAVSGFMPAMSMPFRVANLRSNVHPGDTVTGTLIVDADGGWLEALRVTRKSKVPFVPPSKTATELEVDVPDFALRNQDGRALHTRQFRGQILILTFIYTRCPFPDYCPLMMRNLKAIERELLKEPGLANQVHFLAVSIDPEHDTPAVLHEYGEKILSRAGAFAHWDFATGTPEEIRRMGTWFGLTYWPNSGQITHSLVTALISADGHLMGTFPSNGWQPSDVVSVIRMRLATRKQAGIRSNSGLVRAE